MERIVIDPSVLSSLSGLTHPVEMCDPAGNAVGVFVPTSENHKELYRRANELFDDEEIARAARETGGKTTKEVLEYLASLDDETE